MTVPRTYTDIAGVVRLLKKLNESAFGYELTPSVITDTTEYTAPENTFINAVKAIDGDIVLQEVKNLNGTAVTELAAVTIQQGDVLYFPASMVQLTSGKAILYYTSKMQF